MKKSLKPLFLLLGLWILHACAGSKNALDNVPKLEPLCGTYISANGDAFVDTLNFISWNKVEAMTEFIPASHYIILQDTLIIYPDKSLLMYRISPDRNWLLGLAFWTEGDSLRLQTDNSACPPHLLSQEDQHWLDLEKRHFRVLMSGSIEEQLAVARELCEAGHARSCINLSVADVLATGDLEKVDTSLLIRAGELGDYMGYFRLGEMLERGDKIDRAKFYFQKACDMGHTAGCMMVDILDEN